MKNRMVTILVLGLFLPMFGLAQNPIVQTYFTADPAPMVYNGTVYLYTTHDEDETVDNFFTMYDWRCYSTILYGQVKRMGHGLRNALRETGSFTCTAPYMVMG